MSFKHYVSIFLLICSLRASYVNSQVYQPMLGQLNEWHVSSCFVGCNTSTYYTDGDTIVAGVNYKILDGYHFISRTFLLREDPIEKTVYLATVTPTKTSEFLLYDFSLEVGDTMELLNPVSPYPLLAGYYQLDSIVSRPLEDAQLYRHFYLSPTASNNQSNEFPIWIESVGSLSLINGPGSTPDFNGGGQLSCYFKDDESRYLNMDSIQSCAQEHFLELPELTSETQFKLFPNPSNKSFTISSVLGEFKKGDITDIKGNHVLSFNVKYDQVFYHNLESGVYFVKLMNENIATRYQKLLVFN